jgi:hypothetical protein
MRIPPGARRTDTLDIMFSMKNEIDKNVIFSYSRKAVIIKRRSVLLGFELAKKKYQ